MVRAVALAAREAARKVVYFILAAILNRKMYGGSRWIRNTRRTIKMRGYLHWITNGRQVVRRGLPSP